MKTEAVIKSLLEKKFLKCNTGEPLFLNVCFLAENDIIYI